jgi:hypothetical protein
MLWSSRIFAVNWQNLLSRHSVMCHLINDFIVRYA